MLRSLLILLILAMPVRAETPRVPQSQAEITLSFAPLVKRATPAVVNIYAKRVVEARVSPFQNDPFFREFFRDFGQARPQVQNSLGSGVILSEDGLVVSNFHVVGQATDIRVVLADRREYSAQVILGDEEADLAILKLEDATELPIVPLRDSDTVEVGELVLAIGNPFGVGQTVSSGIVSGLARSGGARGNARGYFIQTDAAINPGNSGGALIDTAGRLIGVNTSILTRSGGSNGIGFAIPANLVAEFVRQARGGADRFEKPWAGISGQPVDADIAASLGLDVPEGIVISALHPASPFRDAGFQPGDILTAVDGKPVNSAAEAVFRMAVAGLGGEAQVTRLRDGAETTVTVAMISAPDQPPRDQREMGQRSVLPGLVISNLNPAVIAKHGLPLMVEGVLVDDPGRYGARMGLRAGDIIRGINSTEITSTEQADRALSADMRSIAIEVQRGLQRLVMRARL
ncbi:trypsin-like peptidase domain-containing protein [Lutimaribacter sp. EGI FJ00015]|uniref:Trypsin-like peptidase domain-containing protein n=1 Tax=Lutimaribacter degradans TaxID=2945989 RepID=A0ACC5ZXZ1_9RHOB|nr:trypsin-like peptidase domain-containing protein [Lutimaribacter sp. EGI FJ00013]MCM2563212.1 trypsin-like peptidase domain-containing protein [Lutimaribacter sp. EGI FJ00013]MCO0614465.1 trypsin-like peptidase domain-containing protein [Lutimaribacter sp. EGI FJ00015]MCO0635934.1 trypsin-like peptidase domain-containing protein [Lutimaribacter sp. EGI FJ00014]